MPRPSPPTPWTTLTLKRTSSPNPKLRSLKSTSEALKHARSAPRSPRAPALPINEIAKTVRAKTGVDIATAKRIHTSLWHHLADQLDREGILRVPHIGIFYVYLTAMGTRAVRYHATNHLKAAIDGRTIRRPVRSVRHVPPRVRDLNVRTSED